MLLIGALGAQLGVGARSALAQPIGEPGAWLSIEGRVTDLAGGAPIAGARVSAGRSETRSDDAGRYALSLPPGRYQVRFEADGHGGATAVDGWQPAERKYLVTGPRQLDMALPPIDPSPRQLRAAIERLRGAPEISAELETLAVAEAADEGGLAIQSLDRLAPAPETVRVLMPDGEIVTMDIETYLKGVVPAEMGYVFRRGFAALEAQAIASRTYAATRCLPATAGDPNRCEPGLDANVDTTTRTQVWRPVHYDITDAAVESTRGQVARAEGELLDTLFFARAVGRTLPSEDSRCCAGRAWAHLRSVASPDPFDRPLGHGAGMSQEGAAVLADWGASAAEIVGHYYSGAGVQAPRPPRLYDGGVTPRQGEPSTRFVFQVRYADADGDPPAQRDLLVDDRSYEMDGPTEPGFDYAMGASYRLELELPEGEHRLAFRFGDGLSEPVLLDAGLVRVEPGGTAGASTEADEGSAEPTDAPPAALPVDAADAADGAPELLAGSAPLTADDLQALPAETALSGFDLRPEIDSDEGSGEEEPGSVNLRIFEGPVVRADFDFMALAARWSGRLSEGAHVDLALRTSRDGITWSDWIPLVDEGEDGRYLLPAQELRGSDRREGWTRLLVARGRYLQARAALHGADEASSLDLVELHYLNSEDGPSAPRSTALRSQALDAGPAVIARAAWGADESKRFDAAGQQIWPPYYTSPRAQLVHHTVTTNDPVDPAAVVRSIYHFHAVTRGWGDIGYNFLVDHRGNVYEGRFGGERDGRIVQGGHAREYNSNSIGVALLGTFTEAAARPSAASERALVELLAAKGVRYGIDPEAPVTLAGTRFAHSVMGHRDALPGYTQCPGDGLYGRLESLRTGVRARMAELGSGPPATPTAAPPPTPRPTPPGVTPQPGGCAERIVGGDFEQESVAWQRNRAYYTAWDTYRGGRAIFLGLRDQDPDEAQSFASVVQRLVLPENVEAVSLRFAARSRGDEGDIRLVRLLGTTGAVIALGSERLPANSDWTEYRYDLGPTLARYAGQELRLYFGVINDGDGERSYLRLDEVSLVVCEGKRESTLPTETASPAPASATPPPPPTVPPATERTPEPTPAGYPGPGGGYVTPTPGAVARPGPICEPILVEGFEAEGLEGWRLGGDLPAERVTEPVFAGQGALRMGLTEPSGDRFGYASVARVASLPRETISASLALRVAQPSRGPEDGLVLELRRPASGEREVLLRPGAAPVGEAEPAWTSYRIDLPESWLEGRFELVLALLNRGQLEAPGQVSSVVIDELLLEVCRQPGRALLPFASR